MPIDALKVMALFEHFILRRAGVGEAQQAELLLIKTA